MPYMKFLFVRSDVCRQLLSDSTSQWTPLLLAIQFPLLGLARDFHPLDNAHAERTNKKEDCITGEHWKTSQNPSLTTRIAGPRHHCVATPLLLGIFRNTWRTRPIMPHRPIYDPIWPHSEFFKAFPPYLPPFMILMIHFTLAANIVTAPCIRMASIP